MRWAVGPVGGVPRSWSPGCGRAERTRMHPFGPVREGGTMTFFGGRAAHSGHRARLGRLMRWGELARGLVSRPWVVVMPECGPPSRSVR